MTGIKNERNESEEKMPGPKAAPIILSDEMRQALEKLEKGHNTRQQIAKRAKIIRLAASGQNNVAISREMGVNRDTVLLWRTRWLGFEPIPMDELSAEERL